ncbi:unnamed protein product [Ilex paraguariensis]|uniref:Uncharacterized protein n=1 Tax=Ilex paraguariensis TaxID=185542 RepID=A0ABC8T2C7_9AQUA
MSHLCSFTVTVININIVLCWKFFVTLSQDVGFFVSSWIFDVVALFPHSRHHKTITAFASVLNTTKPTSQLPHPLQQQAAHQSHHFYHCHANTTATPTTTNLQPLYHKPILHENVRTPSIIIPVTTPPQWFPPSVSLMTATICLPYCHPQQNILILGH